jgi:hypothetical protein
VGYPGFGDGIELDTIIRETLAMAKQPLRPTDAAIVLRERYETKFGIYNHDNPDPNRPLAVIAQHWAEDASEGSALYERIEQFEEREIYQRFGLSLTAFMTLPSDICKKVMEIAGKRLKQKADMTSTVKNDLDRLTGGGGAS